MRQLLAVLLILTPSPLAVADSKPEAPNTDAVLALVGRMSSGHACPISPTLAVTAAHMIDPAPFNDARLRMPYRWSMGKAEGVAEPEGLVSSADLGVFTTKEPFPAWNKAATKAPAPGDYLWLVGYDWDSKDKAYAAEVIRVKVIRVVAGHLIYHPAGKPGSSGSCLWDSQSQVVGVNVAGMDLSNGDEVGLGVGLWLPWFDAAKLEE